MDNLGSSPTVINCTFSENSALDGGGMYNISSRPTVANCTFSGNAAAGLGGGGMFNAIDGGAAGGASPTVANCTFSANSAVEGGGDAAVGP